MILDVGYSANCDINFFGHMVGALAKEADVPIAIRPGSWCKVLEHPNRSDPELALSSIMVDRSTLPYEEKRSPK